MVSAVFQTGKKHTGPPRATQKVTEIPMNRSQLSHDIFALMSSVNVTYYCTVLSVTVGFDILLGTFLAVSFIHADEKNYLFLGKRKSLCAQLFGSTLMLHFMGYLKDDSTLWILCM